MSMHTSEPHSNLENQHAPKQPQKYTCWSHLRWDGGWCGTKLPAEASVLHEYGRHLPVVSPCSSKSVLPPVVWRATALVVGDSVLRVLRALPVSPVLRRLENPDKSCSMARTSQQTSPAAWQGPVSRQPAACGCPLVLHRLVRRDQCCGMGAARQQAGMWMCQCTGSFADWKTQKTL